MPSVSFILGKRMRQPIKKPLSKYPISENGDGTAEFPYTKKGQFSYRTQRDDEQAVGKLYKGFIDDYDEVKEERISQDTNETKRIRRLSR